MKTSLLFPLAVGSLAATVTAVTAAPSPISAVADAGPKSTASPHASASSAPASPPKSGIVDIEPSGTGPGASSSLGVVVPYDGRVLCALSAVLGHDTATIHWPGGRHVPAAVGYKDDAMGLALLVPTPLATDGGLPAARTAVTDSSVRAWGGTASALRAFAIVAQALDGGKSSEGLTPVEPQTTAARRDVRLLGAPLLDGSGGFVGILTHPCTAPTAACQASFQSVSISAIVKFLQAAGPPPTPATAPAHGVASATSAPSASAASGASRPRPPGWLGIAPEVAGTMPGLRIVDVAKSSPAEKAGLHARTAENPEGDIVVAADGEPVTTVDDMARILKAHTVGDILILQVISQGKARDVSVTLQPAPK